MEGKQKFINRVFDFVLGGLLVFFEFVTELRHQVNALFLRFYGITQLLLQVGDYYLQILIVFLNSVKVLKSLFKNFNFLGIYRSLFRLFLKFTIQTLNAVVLLYVFKVKLEHTSPHCA